MCPNAEEIEAVNAYDGDVDVLDAAERFAKAVAKIPQLQQRLMLWRFKHDFAQLATETDADLKSVEEAIQGM